MSTWNWFYIGTEDECNNGVSQINSNCGFPDGSTESWATPRQAYNQDFWFFLQPPPEGYSDHSGSWTQQQMINGINLTLEQSQSNWWPPIPPLT